ncbi:hypothetical protein AQZ52_09020 [Novosphingobium fuchskuhlense]|uniref:Uncharacterized protein n=1 Tax=Novosphingobium fuchskuhlense TaxID=1117702 RepID=A0A117UVQ0_9SPHN|nr:hypothetical protein AQZ52_09020 [Novosphingobium fuchskuhlense]
MLAAACAVGCGESSYGAGHRNPIIGAWHLNSGPPGTCGTDVSFTATSQTDVNPDPGYSGTHKVTYNVSPKVVYVIGNNANPTRYEMLGPNAMQWRGERSTCVFQRTGTTGRPAPTTAPAGNPLFGQWTLQQPAPKGCYVKFTVSADKIVGTDYANEEWPMEVTSYAIAGSAVTANGSSGAIVYRVAGGAMETGNPACRYTRG